jgi:hypothetical protein
VRKRKIRINLKFKKILKDMKLINKNQCYNYNHLISNKIINIIYMIQARIYRFKKKNFKIWNKIINLSHK